MDVTEKFYEIFLIIFFTFSGLCLGSFTTAIIYREKNGLPWYSWQGHAARSYCPACKTNLTPLELIPLFSWIGLKGKCRNCNTPIPVFYPMIELACGLLSVTIFLIFGTGLTAVMLLAEMPFAVALVYSIIFNNMVPQRLVLIVTLLTITVIFLKSLNFQA